MKGAHSIAALANGLALAWPALELRCAMDAGIPATVGWQRTTLAPAWVLGMSRPDPERPSLTVRWHVSMEERSLHFHCPEHAWWVERLLVRSGLSRSRVEPGLDRTLGSIAEAAAFIEARIFTMHGNWLLKRWNEPLTGSLRTFHLWLAWQQLAEEDAARQVLSCCMAECATDVDLRIFEVRTGVEVMAAFVQHFYHGRNEVTAIRAALGLAAEAR